MEIYDVKKIVKAEDISGEYFYKCKIAKSSKRSKDPDLAKRLFELSEQLDSAR